MKCIYLMRHGETEWTLSGQHTGTTDIPLTQKGEEEAAQLGERLGSHRFQKILCSPHKRAQMTCQLAGLMATAAVEPLLAEWNYGRYEGMTTPQIWEEAPGWNIFSNGAPGGESVQEVSSRADAVLQKIQAMDGDTALFSHGHFLRVLAARWLQLPAEMGRLFALSPASISILGFERKNPVILLWNS